MNLRGRVHSNNLWRQANTVSFPWGKNQIESTSDLKAYLEDLRTNLLRVSKKVKKSIDISQKYYKKYYDKKASKENESFQDGDQVLLKRISSHGLEKKYDGPPTLEKIQARSRSL